jgi:protease I
MTGQLNGIRVAVLAADGVEQVELEQPRDAVTRAGAQVTLLSLDKGQIQAMNHDIEPGDSSTWTLRSPRLPRTISTL